MWVLHSASSYRMIPSYSLWGGGILEVSLTRVCILLSDGLPTNFNRLSKSIFLTSNIEGVTIRGDAPLYSNNIVFTAPTS